ncbi:tRNA-specific adenosine deaminase 1 [Sesbania bispinosa]|nr:tRNA-specific adenosine deaminase 1 [Sesbania bispinosa]
MTGSSSALDWVRNRPNVTPVDSVGFSKTSDPIRRCESPSSALFHRMRMGWESIIFGQDDNF